MSAFNQRTKLEFNGEVVRIRVAEGDLVRLEGSKLVAGMPVEAFIQTSPRTVTSYLVKPMRDQIAKAFKGR